MEHFLYSFRIALQRRIRSRGSQVFLVLVIALTLWMVISPGSRQQAVVQVGLVLPEEGAALEELLLGRSSELVMFIPTDESTLDRKVLTGQWDCGLVAVEDFSEKLESLDTAGLFTVKIGAGSTVYPLVQETVAACVMELTAPEIAREYMAANGMDFERTQQSAQRVDVLLKTLDGEQMSPLKLAESTGRRVLTGLAALLTLVWGLYLTVDLGRWLESDGAVRLLGVRTVTELLLPQLTASLLPVLCWAAAVLPWLGGWETLPAFLAFLAVVLALGLVLPRWKRAWQSVMALMPFLTVGSLLLEPVLIDVQSLFPGLAPWLGWLPVTLFCRACDGSLASVGVLLLEAAAITGISLVLDRSPRKG